MAGRKIRDAVDARQCLGQPAASGMSGVAWARSRGIDGRSLNAWRMNLARGGQTRGDELRLVELIERVPRHEARSGSSISVSCGSFVVEVTVPVDEEALAQVLSVVATCRAAPGQQRRRAGVPAPCQAALREPVRREPRGGSPLGDPARGRPHGPEVRSRRARVPPLDVRTPRDTPRHVRHDRRPAHAHGLPGSAPSRGRSPLNITRRPFSSGTSERR